MLNVIFFFCWQFFSVSTLEIMDVEKEKLSKSLQKCQRLHEILSLIDKKEDTGAFLSTSQALSKAIEASLKNIQHLVKYSEGGKESKIEREWSAFCFVYCKEK